MAVTVPVIAGLAVGSIFIILLSVLIMPSSDVLFSPVSHAKADSRIIASANRMTEPQLFFSEYPNGKVQVDRTGNEIEGSAVKYSFEKKYEDGKVNEVRMFIMINDARSEPTGQIYVDCAVWNLAGLGGMTYSSLAPDIANELKTTDCAK